MEKADKLITVKEAAARLSCCEHSIWKWLRRGILPRVKIGRSTRIREKDLDSIIRLGVQPLGPAAGGLVIVRPVATTEGA